jgi:riboflavin kinase/FMN adenylyltransferase
MSTRDKTIRTTREDTPERQGSAIAIGNFDGFHLGHVKILDTLKTIAREKNLESIVLTFTPNPKIYFKRERHLINTYGQKKEILEAQGVDRVSIIDFLRIVEMTNEEFLKDFLVDRFRMKHIVMGENFRFGKARKGDIGFLKTAAQRYGFQFTVVKPVMLDGIRISSTYIRQRLAEARIELANRMLGRRYFIEGVVAEGDKVGRQLGFPTINVDTQGALLPEGVFKTAVQIDDETYDSITYIGYRPTFMGKEKKVESHIFDFDRKIYGKTVRIYFERKLREEMKFTSEKGLIKQIRKDIGNLKVDKGCFF